jgi:AcrR family transcriptional regulator
MSRQNIMEAALELFSKENYSAVSLADISGKVGIKKSSIYSHFSSKEELFLAVLDGQLKEIYTFIDKELNKEKDNRAEYKLYELFKKSIELVANNPVLGGFWKCILYSPPLGLHDQIKTKTSSLNKKLLNIEIQLIKLGIDSGEIKEQSIEKLIYSFSCLIHGNFIMVIMGNNFNLENLDHSWKIYWNGVKN